MNLLEFLDRDPCVYLGRLDRRMSQKFLYESDIDPVLQHQRCHRMSEEMTSAHLPDPRIFQMSPDERAESLGRAELPPIYKTEATRTGRLNPGAPLRREAFFDFLHNEIPSFQKVKEGALRRVKSNGPGRLPLEKPHRAR